MTIDSADQIHISYHDNSELKYAYYPQVNPSSPYDFDGDGKSDIPWYNSTSGKTRVWLMDGLTQLESGQLGGATYLDWQIEATGDYDGDGKADILWYNPSSGMTRMWFMNGTSIYSWDNAEKLSDTDWQIP